MPSQLSRKRQIAAAVIGNALEWYDFVVYGFLTVIISRLFFPAESEYASLLLTMATFGVGFFMRPVGGILIGLYADRKGRKAALQLIIGLMTLSMAIIAFAPGRGGHANEEPNKICAPHTLLSSAAEFGRAARIPVTSLVAANDSYFSPAFSLGLADAFRSGGGRDDLRTLPSVGSEGHWMIETEAGVKAASSDLARALNLPKPMATKKP